MNRTVDVILGLTAAVATALLLALIARDDIGMPPDIVREDALIGASIMIAAVAGISSRKVRQSFLSGGDFGYVRHLFSPDNFHSTDNVTSCVTKRSAPSCMRVS